VSIIIGMDYGEKRCGFAVSDPDEIIAMPLQTIEVRNEQEIVSAAKSVIVDKDASMLVVGLPLNMDGSSGPMAQKVNDLLPKLREAIGIPVTTWDERLSTSMVDRTLIDADVSRQKRKQVRDKLAAQVILQGYLDSSGPHHALQNDY
jgi:putative Holliday junction resolvase